MIPLLKRASYPEENLVQRFDELQFRKDVCQDF
jgi:hypothetical protein